MLEHMTLMFRDDVFGRSGILREREDFGEARKEAGGAGGALRCADCGGGSAAENGETSPR